MLRPGDVPAKDFLRSLTDVARARFTVLFQHMANYGTVSAKRFKPEMQRLFAFRHEVHKRQIRFPCFQDGKRWILTHGFFKPGAQKGKGKWPQREIDRAEEIRGAYYTRKRRVEAARENE